MSDTTPRPSGALHDPGAAGAAGAARPPHVLVVDDTDGNRYAVARLLRGAGMEVTEAATGAEAIDAARRLPDLVVLDINLPDMTGYDVLRTLKQRPETASIPIMHLTASYVGSADQAYGLDAGADAYLTHPMDPVVFLATVRALLRAGAADARIREAAREREELLAQAEAARAEAEHANRAKSAFLATMSHELRTPLNAIAGYVELLDIGVHGRLSDGQRDYVQRIGRSSRLLLSVINDILNFARLEAGHVEFRAVPHALHPILAGIGALVEPQVRAKGVTYAYEPCDPSAVVIVDPERVEQVMLNLLSNAVKFTDQGGEVRLSCEVGEHVVRVRVTDTGRGVPADKLDAIFDPFVQVDRHLTAGPHQGTGLGLAISRDLARLMGGDLAAEPRERGAAFVLTLPRAS